MHGSGEHSLNCEHSAFPFSDQDSLLKKMIRMIIICKIEVSNALFERELAELKSEAAGDL